MRRQGVTIETLREFAVAWLRMAFALQVVLMVGGFSLAAVYLPGALLLATPLVLVRGFICRRPWPFLRPGYGLVAVYGPVLFFLLAACGVWGAGDAAFWSIGYEIAALFVTGIYILLWRLGDRMLGDREGPRIVPRWAFAVMLSIALCFYVPFVLRAAAVDRCMDLGGRVVAGGACERSR